MLGRLEERARVWVVETLVPGPRETGGRLRGRLSESRKGRESLSAVASVQRQICELRGILEIC